MKSGSTRFVRKLYQKQLYVIFITYLYKCFTVSKAKVFKCSLSSAVLKLLRVMSFFWFVMPPVYKTQPSFKKEQCSNHILLRNNNANYRMKNTGSSKSIRWFLSLYRWVSMLRWGVGISMMLSIHTWCRFSSHGQLNNAHLLSRHFWK